MPLVEADSKRGSRSCQAPRQGGQEPVDGVVNTSGSSKLAVWPGAGHDDQARGRDGALEHPRGLQASLILVAGQDRSAFLGQLVGERVHGRAGELADAAGQGQIVQRQGIYHQDDLLNAGTLFH